MNELISRIMLSWNNSEELQIRAMEVIEKQLELAGQIADKELQFDSVYLGEKEASYKATDSEIKARSRMVVGTEKTKLEYEFETLKYLLDVLTLRVAQLSTQQTVDSDPQVTP